MTQPVFFKHFKKKFIFVLAILFMLEQIYVGLHHKISHEFFSKNSYSSLNKFSSPLNHQDSEDNCFICALANFSKIFLTNFNQINLFIGNILVLLLLINYRFLPYNKVIFIKSRAPPRLF